MKEIVIDSLDELKDVAEAVIESLEGKMTYISKLVW